MEIIVRPFGAKTENLVSRNIVVPKYMQGQIISKPMTPERFSRNRWIVGKLREKHFGKGAR